MTAARLEVDHVLLGVADLDDAARRLLDDHGLRALPGGRHPRWGTANRVVPLGAAYLELVTVVDPVVAAGSDFGRWITAMLDGTAPAWGWVVRSPDLDAHAARLGLVVETGSRARPDGSTVSWRLAGVADAARDPQLPFLIAWDPGVALPGTAAVQHPAGRVRLERLEVDGDADRVLARAGGPVERVQVEVGGAPGVRRLLLGTDAGPLALP
ncbi:MAG: VOC family protein [Candidatus Nanopelagicales bacterium]